MDQRKKNWELTIVSRFLRQEGITISCVRERESPDFRLRLPNGKMVGVEVTEPWVARRERDEVQKSATVIRGVLEERQLTGLFVLEFDANAFGMIPSRKSRQREALAIASVAEGLTGKMVVGEEDLRSRGLSRLKNLEITRPRGDLVVLPGWSGSDCDDLGALLAQKSSRVAKWRMTCPEIDEFWLLWVVRAGMLSSASSPTAEDFATSGFERVYLVDANTGTSSPLA